MSESESDSDSESESFKGPLPIPIGLEDGAVDFNGPETLVEAGEIDPEYLEKMINYIKVRHRSQDALNEWTKYDFASVFDIYASAKTPRLAQIDKLHQESLQRRAIKAGLIDEPFDYRPKQYTSHYDILDQATSRIKPTQYRTDASAGFPSLLPLGKEHGGHSYIASIDRWPANLLSRKLCKEEYQDKNKPLIIQNYVELMELGGPLGDDLKRRRDNSTSPPVPTWRERIAAFTPPANIDDAKFPAHFWTFEYFKKSPFAEAFFRLGDDDNGHILRAKLKVFLQYLSSNRDDSPLYLFEDNVRRCDISRQMVNQYKIPEYFQQDLVTDVIPDEHRPPFQWILMGAERSGTRMHLDPRCTSAWNLSVCGIKHWVLFRPGVPDNVAKGHVVMTPEEVKTRKAKGNPQTVYFFIHILPRLRRWIHERERKREIRLRQRAVNTHTDVNGYIPKSGRIGLNTRARVVNGRQLQDGLTELTFHPSTTASEDFGENNDFAPKDADSMTLEELERAREVNRAKSKSNSIKWDELEDGYGFMEFYQYPGEVIYVPSGYFHAVINVTDTIAFTQNFTNHSNFPLVWRHMRKFNKRTTRRWRRQLRHSEPEYAQLAQVLDDYDNYKLSEFRPASKKPLLPSEFTDSSDNSEISASEISECASPWEPSDEDAD